MAKPARYTVSFHAAPLTGSIAVTITVYAADMLDARRRAADALRAQGCDALLTYLPGAVVRRCAIG